MIKKLTEKKMDPPRLLCLSTNLVLRGQTVPGYQQKQQFIKKPVTGGSLTKTLKD